MNRKLLVLVLALLAGMMLVAGGSAAAVPPLPPEPLAKSLRGVLSVIWIDRQDGTDGALFYLTTDEDQTFELLPGAVTQPELYKLYLKEVVVSARSPKSTAARGSHEFQALELIAIQPASTQAATQSGIGPETAMLTPTSTVLGHKKWVSIGCKFPDRPDEAHPLSYFDEMYANSFPGLNHYWRELSNDRIYLDGSHATGWYSLPKPYTSYFNSGGSFLLDAFREDCLAAADPDLYYPDYYGLNLIVNGDDMDYAWGGGRQMTLDGVTRSWGITWMTQWTHAWVSEFEHEMGHSYGLWHSYVGNQPGPYRNFWDVMSKDDYNCDLFNDPIYSCYGQHTIARNKAYLGWINPDRVYVAGPGSHTVTLERSAMPGTEGYLMVEIPVTGSTTHYYTLEARRLTGYDAKLPGNAVIIHEMGVPPHMFQLVDAAEGFPSSDHPAALWLPGETFNSGAGGISVHIDETTATGYVVTIHSGLASSTVTLAPTDDTYVRRSTPNATYGLQDHLLAEPRDSSSWINTWTILKFDPGKIPANAYRLRLRLSVNDDTGVEIPNAVSWTSPNYAHTETPWTESGLTWNNRSDTWPVPSLTEPRREGDWIEWTVTTSLALHGSPSFALGGGDATGVVEYSSKEGPNPPQLLVDYLVDPAPAETHTFTPTNDTFVRRSRPDTVYGKHALINAKGGQRDAVAFIKFNVKGLEGTVEQAMLRLLVKNPSPGGGEVLAVSPYYAGTTDQWLETGLTWNNAPGLIGSPLADLGRVRRHHWVEVDVTQSVVEALADTSGRVSFAIRSDSYNAVAYSSKEGTSPPELVVLTR